ncbi:MAG: hypothetical protein EA001_01610 [Oscillatoriales cyanobacterium]|nr:MAG: hypothetical protein EA001_01610 [Oscillatoriales cyanobacterium]
MLGQDNITNYIGIFNPHYIADSLISKISARESLKPTPTTTHRVYQFLALVVRQADLDRSMQMADAVTKSLGSKGLKPLVTTTDSQL